MNFTREPIIETIITPREGSRLLVKSSKEEEKEEYFVDAVEIVSFGQALFYRSLEKPKPFLLPVGDYEISEVKEARVVLKNAQMERTIKIGGGREASIRKEEIEEEKVDVVPVEPTTGEVNSEVESDRFDRKKNGRRRNRRRAIQEKEEMSAEVKGESAVDQAPPLPPPPVMLIPPPPKLISETIDRYKQMFSTEPKESVEAVKEPLSTETELKKEAPSEEDSYPSPTDWSRLIP